MGIVDEFLAEGRRIDGAEMWSGTKLLARITLEGMKTRFPFILDIPQDRTEALLTHHLEAVGGNVERGVELTDLSQDGGGVDVRLQHASGLTEQARFAYVVGCDGGHSRVRELAPTTLKGSFHGIPFVLADVDVETDLDPSMMSMFLHREGMAGSFPLPGTRTRVFIQIAEVPADSDGPTLDDTQQLLDERVGPRMHLLSSHWLTYFEVHHGQVPRYRFGRVLLAGDAGHIHSPAGGQGMNTGVQDANNLAWKLALVCRGVASPALLDSYDAERHPVGAAVVKATTAATRVASSHSSLVAEARSVLFGLVGHRVGLRDKVVNALGETSVNYRHSPIVGEHLDGRHGRTLIKPGEHVPTMDGVDLDSTRHTVLLVRGDSNAGGEPSLELADELEGAVGDLADVVARDDPDGALHGALGAERSTDLVAVVRPDHYLGYLAVPPDAEAVRHCFHEMVLR
jgi:2-polyprenyl-6-methoxyphenol hydroxylase-like FAD-dependent oxidoreductase